MESQKKEKETERVGLVVSGERGLVFLPRTEWEEKHSKPTVKTHPWQREEHRGNHNEMTIRATIDWLEENVTEGTWSHISLASTFMSNHQMLFIPLDSESRKTWWEETDGLTGGWWWFFFCFLKQPAVFSAKDYYSASQNFPCGSDFQLIASRFFFFLGH